MSIITGIIEAFASRERDKVVDLIMKLRKDEEWIKLWKKHHNAIDFPLTIINGVMQDFKGIPDPVKDYLMNLSDDLVDRIRGLAEGKTSSAKADKNNETLEMPSSYSLKTAMIKITDTTTMLTFLDGINKTGRGKEMMELAGEEEFIDEIVEKILALQGLGSANDAFELLATSLLGKKEEVEVKLYAANLAKIRLHTNVQAIFGPLSGDKKHTFSEHLATKDEKNVNAYLDKLNTFSPAEIRSEINKVYKDSFHYTGKVAKIAVTKAGKTIAKTAPKVWNWARLRLAFLAASFVLAVITIMWGIFFNKPIMTGVGTLLGLLIFSCSWLFTGILPLISYIAGKEIFPKFIKSVGFWITVSGACGMLVRGIHGPEAFISLLLLVVMIVILLSITKFKSYIPNWIVIVILSVLFIFTYVSPKTYKEICKGIDKQNERWLTSSSTRSNVMDNDAGKVEGYAKKNIHNVYLLENEVLKKVEGVVIPKGQSLKYIDFMDTVKVSTKGIHFFQVMLPDSFGEYSDNNPEYYVDANLIKVNEGSSITSKVLGSLPFVGNNVKRELGVESSVDGNYSIEKRIEDGKELWKVISKTNDPFKIEDLPLNNRRFFNISGGNYQYSINNSGNDWDTIKPDESRRISPSVWLKLADGESVVITLF